MGYRVVDLIADHFSTLREKPVGAKGDPAVLRSMFLEPPPAGGTDMGKIFERLDRDVFPNIMNLGHPRFFAFLPGPSNFVSVMADALAAGFNVFNGSWLGGSSAAAMETRGPRATSCVNLVSLFLRCYSREHDTALRRLYSSHRPLVH